MGPLALCCFWTKHLQHEDLYNTLYIKKTKQYLNAQKQAEITGLSRDHDGSATLVHVPLVQRRSLSF